MLKVPLHEEHDAAALALLDDIESELGGLHNAQEA